MWPDGICRVTDTRYTKTIQYQDINYQLSQNEDKTAIFEAWCDFLNYFDSSVQFQLSFVNLSASQETFARSISIPPCGDEFDGIRTEYAGMLQNQLARGNNGLIKTKYLTFGVEADNLRAAKPRLERIETDLLNNFKRLCVVAAPLNGFERLHVMHDILRMDEQEPFRFSWDWLAPSYIIELAGADLVSITTPLTLYTENILLANDFSKQKKLPKKKVNKIVEIDDNGNIIIPK